MSANTAAHAIILFDGVCVFCNRWVRFIAKRDNHAYFKFAPLNSAAANKLLLEHPVNRSTTNTIILLAHGKVYTRSTAALHIARRLTMPWPLFYGFIVVPPFLRDAVYRLVARFRYRWFGKYDRCPAPGPELKARFL